MCFDFGHESNGQRNDSFSKSEEIKSNYELWKFELQQGAAIHLRNFFDFHGFTESIILPAIGFWRKIKRHLR